MYPKKDNTMNDGGVNLRRGRGTRRSAPTQSRCLCCVLLLLGAA